MRVCVCTREGQGEEWGTYVDARGGEGGGVDLAMNESAEGASWVIASIVLSTFVFVWGVGIHFGGCVECVWNAEPLAGGGRRCCVFGTTLRTHTHACVYV